MAEKLRIVSAEGHCILYVIRTLQHRKHSSCSTLVPGKSTKRIGNQVMWAASRAAEPKSGENLAQDRPNSATSSSELLLFLREEEETLRLAQLQRGLRLADG